MSPLPCLRDRMPVWAELDDMLGRLEFAQGLTGVPATYRRLQTFAARLGPARALYHDPARLLAGMEWAGIVDPAMMHAAMVHYGAAATALVECGRPSPRLDPLTADLDSARAPGAIVATELGRGGSQVGIRTVARYDRASHSFTLTTPDDASMKIMPNVGWTGLARVAVVTARLVVDGIDHGVHAFAFRFPHPGAEVVPLPGGAPVALDYSAIRFRCAEVPFGYWLSDTAAITGEGVHDPLSPAQRLARSLQGVNSAVVCAAVALTSAARACVAVAFRYNVQRVVGDQDTPALGLTTHSEDLASALARVYASGTYVEKVRRDFIDERTAAASAPSAISAPEGASYAPWLAADRDRTLAKAAATLTLESVAMTCRRLCGFQGVLHTNRITVYEDMAKSFHAAGGDTRLLLLEAGKRLLQGGGLPAVPGRTGPGAGGADATLRLVALQESVLTDGMRNRVDPDDPYPHLREIEELARTHLVRRTLEEFDEAVAAADGRWRPVLTAVRRLYGLDVVLGSAAWHLDQGSLRPGDTGILHTARADAVAEVTGQLDLLVEGLAAPAGRIGALIGREDYTRRFASLFPEPRPEYQGPHL